MHEINKRLEEISDELNQENITEERIAQLEKEVEELTENKRKLIDASEKRQATLKKALETKNIVEKNDEERKEIKMEENNILASSEYRSAFLKTLQRKQLTESEERAMSTATNSVGSVIPTETQDAIVKKIFEQAPLLNEITLLRVNGNVTFSVESTNTDAVVHVQGATLNDDGDVLIPVALTGYEVNKYITISKSVSRMSVSAFETWLVDMLARMIGRKLIKLIINGSGSSQPTGIEKANTWNTNNSVTVAKTASLTKANVLDLDKLLGGGYSTNAKWLMSKKTLLGDFRPLQNKGVDDFFYKEGDTYYVEGYPVMLDDSVTEHEAFLGDFKMYIGNLAEDITVDNGKKLSNNSFEYLGSAIFDGKPADGAAFVKLVKATA